MRQINLREVAREQRQANPDLYSPDLDRRYKAAINVHRTSLGKKWPLGCSGAANAFLALIGPSMGGAIRGETVGRGGASRPYRHSMDIGRDVMSFDWGDQRITRWTRLCSAMLGGERYVSALTALLNLDWRHSTNERDIPTQELLTGFDGYVWPLLGQIRPRIVSPLTNLVWDTMLSKVEPLRVSFSVCPVPLPREPIIFRSPGSDFNTMLIKPHNHPSRHFLTNHMISDVGRACEWFLNQAN